ncbi:MAG TPA: MFS transporter [Rhodopila sp.]|nr:MFS transporter [Rhodopila sp.]
MASQALIADQHQDSAAEPGGSFGAALLMFAVLLVSYAINAMDRQIFPLLLADVRREYGLSLQDAGLLSTIFTLGMAIAGMPTGYLLAQFTRKTVVQFGIVIFSAGTALTAISGGFADMFAYRAATGIGEAMQLTALIAIAANYFTRHRNAAVGSINCSFGIGAIVGPAAGGYLFSEYATWRAPIVAFGAIGFVAVGIIAIAVRPWFSDKPGAADHATHTSGASAMWNHNTIVLTMLSILGGLIIYAYLGLYPTYLREGLKYAPATTGATMSIYGIGVLASIAGGWIGDRLSPRLVLATAFLIATALGYLLFHGIASPAAQATLSFIWGFVVSGTIYVNIAGYHVKSVQSHLSSRASGLFVTSLYAAAAAAGYSLGFLASHFGWAMAADVQISLVSLIGAALALTLRPDRMAARHALA